MDRQIPLLLRRQWNDDAGIEEPLVWINEFAARDANRHHRRRVRRDDKHGMAQGAGRHTAAAGLERALCEGDDILLLRQKSAWGIGQAGLLGAGLSAGGSAGERNRQNQEKSNHRLAHPLCSYNPGEVGVTRSFLYELIRARLREIL